MKRFMDVDEVSALLSGEDGMASVRFAYDAPFDCYGAVVPVFDKDGKTVRSHMVHEEASITETVEAFLKETEPELFPNKDSSLVLCSRYNSTGQLLGFSVRILE